MSDSTPSPGISVQALVIAGGMAVFGFLASDFVDGRDARTQSVDATLREVMELQLKPLTEDFGDLKREVKEAVMQMRNDTDRVARRVTEIEGQAAMKGRDIVSMGERIDRLSSFIQQRSLERIEQ